ncbi:MAG: two-component system heavy metal sensor histidine kinase CusS [Motiliproteus sp.]|jgi:two-component system heavy metal sensor histidine kinase CusS
MLTRKSRPVSLTLRVLLFVSIAIGLSLFLTASLVISSVNQHFMEQDTAELRVITQSITKILKQSTKATQLRAALTHAVSGHHSVYYQVESSQPALLFRSNKTDFTQTTQSLPPSPTIDTASLRIWRSDGRTYRGAVIRVSENGVSFRVTVAIDMDFHLQFLNEFRESLGLIMLGTGIATVLITWLAIRQGHLPLRGLSNSLHNIETNHLHLRIDTATLPIELLELAQSFNHMIGRLEEGFERLSHFSSDIAHELRTPLTNLITQTQVTLNKTREPDIYRELIYSNLEELERLTKMVSDMLWLAKCDNDLIKPVMEPLDLTAEIGVLFDFFEALAEEKQILLILEGRRPLILGDRSLLRRALSNLLSNAIRHTPRGENVVVTLDSSADTMASISMSNPGINIPPEHLSRLFDRFYRVDPSRQQQTEGTGLGLAITKAIIESHGGSISAHSAKGVVTFSALLPLKK